MKKWNSNRNFVKDCMSGKLKFLDGILASYEQATGEKLEGKELKDMAKAAGNSNDLIRDIQKRIMEHGK